MILRIFFHTCFFLIAVQCINAQQSENINLRKYSTEDGLASYNVKKIIQDKNGFIWIATQGGLSRFDGRTFLNYTQNGATTRRLAGADIRGITYDQELNCLWVLPTEGGLNKIDIITGDVTGSTVIPYSKPETFSLTMKIVGANLWIGSFDGVKLFDRKTGQFSDLSLPSIGTSIPGTWEVGQMLDGPDKNIWVAYCGFGLVVYDRQTLEIKQEIPLIDFIGADAPANIRFYDALFNDNNDLLVATEIGLRKIRFEGNLSFSGTAASGNLSPLNNVTVTSIMRTGNSQILISSLAGLFRSNLSLTAGVQLRENEYNVDEGWTYAIHHLFEDRQGNFWMGCQQGLAYLNGRASPFKAFYQDVKRNASMEHVRSVCQVDSIKLIAGTINGLATVNLVTGSIQIEHPSTIFHNVFKDPFNRIQASTNQGMFIVEGKKLRRLASVYPEFKSFEKNPTNSCANIGDSILIMGTENEKGILIWNYKQKTVSQIIRDTNAASLGSDIVNKVYFDRFKRLWVLSDKNITIISNNFKDFKVFAIPTGTANTPAVFYFDVCESGEKYWLASYGIGLIELDSSLNVISILNRSDGLPDDGVYQLFKSGTDILVTTNNGLSVFNTVSRRFKNYYKADGLHSNSFEEVASAESNGIIYGAGLKGITAINPAALYTNTDAPQLFLNSIQLTSAASIKDTFNLSIQKLQIPSTVLQASLGFSVINYPNPDRVSIVYKIVGEHEDWIELGNVKSLPLIGMPPGMYHILVKAFNEDGVESDVREITLEFLPKWYQTWWFKLLLLAIAIAAIYAIYRVRILQLKKEQDIRTRLASDLHDDLGSTLNSVKVYANLALLDKNRDKHLSMVRESISEAIIGVKDMIWVLDDKKDNIEHLVSRLSQFAIPLCEANNMKFSVDTTESARYHKLGREEKRNIYMMLKESVNNAVKYANAPEISVAIDVKKDKPAFLVSDNGIGFYATDKHEGNGLKNLIRRARQIHYEVKIISSPGNGTQISLQRQ